MDTASAKDRATGALKLAAAAVGLAAPPVLLARVIGNPLPALPVDWSQVAESIQAGLVPSSVWVNVLAATAWLAWTALVLTLTVEVAAVARNRPSSTSVPGWVRHLAQTLVAAAIALAGPGQQPLAAAVAGPSFVAVAAPAVPTPGALPLEDEPAAEGRVINVAEGDSWSGLAADVLGDASLGPRLREANVGRPVAAGQTVTATTAFVEPGWSLLVPAHLDLNASAAQPATASGTEDVANGWVVDEGDHLWGIAEQTIAEAWGRTPTDPEIAPYWQEVVEENRARLLPPGDPDLIYPEQEFVTPPVLADPDPPSPAGGEPAASPWKDAIERPRPVEPDGAEDEAGSPRAGPGWQRAIEGAAVEAGDSLDAADVEEQPRTTIGFPVGLAGGVAATSLLATGVLATLRWRRRAALQQRMPGLRLPTPLPEAQDEEATLDVAAASDRVLDDLGWLLASIPADTHPVLVTITDDGEVTLLFDERDDLPDPPLPWAMAYDGTEGPVGWRAELGSRGPERSIGLPLLVTLGRTGTTNVLANVAAMANLALAGDPVTVRRRQRMMSLEVATSRISIPVEVAVAGDDRLATLDRVRFVEDPDEEVRLGLQELEQDIVVEDRTPRLLVCHGKVSPPVVPVELRGMVGVLAPESVGIDWVLGVEDEETGRLQLPGGATVTLVLPDVDPDVIDDELTRLDEGASELGQAAPEWDGAVAADPSTNGNGVQQTVPSTEPAWCEVRILGPVEVVVDGRPVQGLTPRLLEVFMYLATHGDCSKERLDAAVWPGGGRSAQRVKVALSRIRSILGEGPDGKLLVPRRHNDEFISLSEHVGTDLDRALAHLAVAVDLPAEAAAREVASALALVRGEPFEGHTYSWTTDTSQQAIVKLQDAAVKAARTLQEAGDLDAAEAIIRRAKSLLDGNGWLYLEEAMVEKARGHPERADLVYRQYRRTLDDDADELAGTVATPPPEIELAFKEMVGG